MTTPNNKLTKHTDGDALPILSTLLPQEKTPSPLPQDLKQQIESFDRSTLRKSTVYFVNTSSAWYKVFKTHGFIAVEFPRIPSKKNQVRIYSCALSVMHVSFQVSKKFTAAVEKSSAFSHWTKQAVILLQDQTFPSGEHFLRAVLQQKALIAREDITQTSVQEWILTQATDPDAELRELIALDQTLHGKRGAMLVSHPDTVRAKTDKALAETGNQFRCTKKAYSHIDPLVLHEVAETQKLYARYMNEKAGIGKTTPSAEKEKVQSGTTNGIMSKLVYFNFIPAAKNIFQANCNKATATLLQMAENFSANRQSRKPQIITGASFCSLGASQRMRLWNPCESSLSQQVNTWLNQSNLTMDGNSCQTWADKKDDILQIIMQLPLEQQQKALEQARDQQTALGKIFHKKRSSRWFKEDWFKPCESRGALKQVKNRLTEIAASSLSLTA